MNERLSSFLKNRLVAAIAAIVFGLILIFGQAQVLEVLIRFMGYVCIGGAIACALVYFVRANHDPMQVVAAVFLAFLGLIFILATTAIVDLFPVIMGILLVLGGFSDLANAYALSQVGDAGWKVTLVMGVLVLVLGILICLHPGFIADMIIAFMGVTLLLSGVFDLYMMAHNRKL